MVYQANFWLCKINQSRCLYLARIWKVENYLSPPHPKKKPRLSYPLHPFYVLCKISLSSAQIPTIFEQYFHHLHSIHVLISHISRDLTKLKLSILFYDHIKNKVIKFITCNIKDWYSSHTLEQNCYQQKHCKKSICNYAWY